MPTDVPDWVKTALTEPNLSELFTNKCSEPVAKLAAMPQYWKCAHKEIACDYLCMGKVGRHCPSRIMQSERPGEVPAKIADPKPFRNIIREEAAPVPTGIQRTLEKEIDDLKKEVAELKSKLEDLVTRNEMDAAFKDFDDRIHLRGDHAPEY